MVVERKENDLPKFTSNVVICTRMRARQYKVQQYNDAQFSSITCCTRKIVPDFLFFTGHFIKWMVSSDQSVPIVNRPREVSSLRLEPTTTHQHICTNYSALQEHPLGILSQLRLFSLTHARLLGQTF